MLLLDRPAPVAPEARAGERRRTHLVLAAALLATVGLRLLYLGFPLGIDEGGVAFIAKAWGTGHGSLYGAYWLDRPPLLVALYKLAVLGGPTGIRVLGIVAALALVAATTVVTRAVAGERAARDRGRAERRAGELDRARVGLHALGAARRRAGVASIGCLVAAHRRGQARWLVGAGLLAVAAALIKQSFLDAGFAGAVFLIASSAARAGRGCGWAAAYAAGALIPLAGVAVWLARRPRLPRRASSTRCSASASTRWTCWRRRTSRSTSACRACGSPAWAPACSSCSSIALRGLAALRGDRVLAVTLAAWLGAGAVGVLGGGSYWPHYLIELVAPASLLTGAALASVRARGSRRRRSQRSRSSRRSWRRGAGRSEATSTFSAWMRKPNSAYTRLPGETWATASQTPTAATGMSAPAT